MRWWTHKKSAMHFNSRLSVNVPNIWSSQATSPNPIVTNPVSWMGIRLILFNGLKFTKNFLVVVTGTKWNSLFACDNPVPLPYERSLNYNMVCRLLIPSSAVNGHAKSCVMQVKLWDGVLNVNVFADWDNSKNIFICIVNYPSQM